MNVNAHSVDTMLNNKNMAGNQEWFNESNDGHEHGLIYWSYANS